MRIGTINARTFAALTLAFFAAAAAIGYSSFVSAAAGGPTVVLSSTSATTTNAAAIAVTASFSEPVSGFATTSVSATNATVTNLAGTSTSFTFDVNPTADGAVTVQIPADAVMSVATSTGNQASNILSFTSDMAAPIISSVGVVANATSTTITWNTNEPATDQVAYGTTASYTASSTLVSTTSTSHSATLIGLSASTTYHYQIQSADAAGNMATTSDSTFTTAAPAAVAPVITNVSATATGTTTATVTWNTDVAATSRVYYGTSAALGSVTALSTSATTSHSVGLTGLTEATLYHYKVESIGAGGTATSSDNVFTSGSTASSTPLAVTSVDTVSSTATADGTFANGWTWVLHFVVPSNEPFLRLKFADFTTTSSSSTIPIANNVRYFSPQSSNAASSASAIVETNNNYGTALILTGDTSTSTAGLQIDVTVQAAVPVRTTPGVYSTIFGALSTTTAQ
ncbi:MAG: fibronectin type III domain-containing protein [bacterium]|nr:fibronectin type III domain-containing protein [bacterium]